MENESGRDPRSAPESPPPVCKNLTRVRTTTGNVRGTVPSWPDRSVGRVCVRLILRRPIVETSCAEVYPHFPAAPTPASSQV